MYKYGMLVGLPIHGSNQELAKILTGYGWIKSTLMYEKMLYWAVNTQKFCAQLPPLPSSTGIIDSSLGQAPYSQDVCMFSLHLHWFPLSLQRHYLQVNWLQSKLAICVCGYVCMHARWGP